MGRRSPARRALARPRNRDGLDLDELPWVAEDSYAEQCARHVVIAEETGYLVPGGDQVTAIAARDVDGRLQHIQDRRPFGAGKLSFASRAEEGGHSGGELGWPDRVH